jgi:predicted RND superfamily exporter protein
LTDDVPTHADLRSDLDFVEEKFNGVMPLEILVNTKKKRAALRRSNLKKAAKLQEKLETYPSISRTLSLVDLTQYVRQVFFDGGAEAYLLPDRNEEDFIKLYLSNTDLDTDRLSRKLTDSSQQIIRITGNVGNIGSIEMAKLVDSVQADINEIFDQEKYDVTITGTTKIFIRGNEFLIQNLLQSLALAFVVIALIMGWLFRSTRIVLISLVPNFLPLLMVAGVMGFMGVALKPSTALVFSVAFGIAVDDSIHFLARYRLALRMGDTVSEAISNTFKDTGVSMIYTSVILFFGFVIFTASSFGGTKALGLLASSTLAIAMFGNLLLLPALLLTFEPKKSKQKLPTHSPLIPIPAEEEDDDSADADMEIPKENLAG